MEFFIVLLSLAAFASAEVPKGYILDVAPTCTSNKADATVVVTSDLNVKAVFHCSGQSYTKAIDVEKTTKLTFKIHYSDKKDKKCFFKTASANTNVYMITVELFWGEPGASATHQIQTQKEIYKIVCTTGGKQSVASKGVSVGKRPFAPERKLTNLGSISGAKMDLKLYDAKDKSLESKKVAIGKIVYLKGVSSGSKAIVPVDCDAVNEKNEKYQILRGGCGDGIVFRADAGFTANGKATRSPYFGFFSFHTGTKIQFSCTFIECTDVECALKRNTCVQRKRRSIEDSRPLDVIKPKEALPKLFTVSTNYRIDRNEDSSTFPGQILIVYSSPPAAAERTLIKETKDRKYTMIMFAILSCFTAVSLIVSLYMCTKQGRYRSELSNVKA